MPSSLKKPPKGWKQTRKKFIPMDYPLIRQENTLFKETGPDFFQGQKGRADALTVILDMGKMLKKVNININLEAPRRALEPKAGGEV
jgi:hypothetical protein